MGSWTSPHEKFLFERAHIQTQYIWTHSYENTVSSERRRKKMSSACASGASKYGMGCRQRCLPTLQRFPFGVAFSDYQLVETVPQLILPLDILQMLLSLCCLCYHDGCTAPPLYHSYSRCRGIHVNFLHSRLKSIHHSD